jgi:hypothetical protein
LNCIGLLDDPHAPIPRGAWIWYLEQSQATINSENRSATQTGDPVALTKAQRRISDEIEDVFRIAAMTGVKLNICMNPTPGFNNLSG